MSTEPANVTEPFWLRWGVLLTISALGIGLLATRLGYPNGPAALGVWVGYCSLLGLGFFWYEKRRGPEVFDIILAIPLLLGGKELFNIAAATKPPTAVWVALFAMVVIHLILILGKFLTRAANRRIARFHASQAKPTHTNL
jgi:hypothetical protein